MKVRDIMTSGVHCVRQEESLSFAAAKMRQLNVGVLPVCHQDRLTGLITDRDITVRAVAEGRDPVNTPVQAIMSHDIVYVFEDQDLEAAARVMELNQVRRLPVLSREKSLVGILSLGDVATQAGIVLSGEALREISQRSAGAANANLIPEGSKPKAAN